MREILVRDWDPAGMLRDAALAGPEFHDEQATTVVAMLAAAAAPPEVQRYLREQEHATLGYSLHPFEVRREIAHAAWRAVRSL